MTIQKPNKNKLWSLAFWFSLLFLCFSLFSCSPRLQRTETKHIQKDSVFYSVNYIKKDTLITVRGDTIKAEIPIYKLSEKPIRTQTERGSILLSKKNDTVIAVCEINELKEQISLLHREIRELRTESLKNFNATESQTNRIPFDFYLILAILILLLIIKK